MSHANFTQILLEISEYIIGLMTTFFSVYLSVAFECLSPCIIQSLLLTCKYISLSNHIHPLCWQLSTLIVLLGSAARGSDAPLTDHRS